MSLDSRRLAALPWATPIARNSEMKSYKHLFERVCTFENLHEAYLRARKGKRFKPDVGLRWKRISRELMFSSKPCGYCYDWRRT